VSLNLDLKCFSKCFNCMLGSRIQSLDGYRAIRNLASKVDQCSAAFAKMLNGDTGTDNKSPQICIEHPLKILQRHVHDPSIDRTACVIYPRIEPAELAFRHVCRVPQNSLVCNVPGRVSGAA